MLTRGKWWLKDSNLSLSIFTFDFNCLLFHFRFSLSTFNFRFMRRKKGLKEDFLCSTFFNNFDFPGWRGGGSGQRIWAKFHFPHGGALLHTDPGQVSLSYQFFSLNHHDYCQLHHCHDHHDGHHDGYHHQLRVHPQEGRAGWNGDRKDNLLLLPRSQVSSKECSGDVAWWWWWWCGRLVSPRGFEATWWWL